MTDSKKKILEQATLLRDEVAEVRAGFREIRQRLAAVEIGVSDLQRDQRIRTSLLAARSAKIDGLEVRIGRAENQLGMNDK